MGIFKSDEGREPENKPRTRKVLPLLPLRDIVVYPAHGRAALRRAAEVDRSRHRGAQRRRPSVARGAAPDRPGGARRGRHPRDRHDRSDPPARRAARRHREGDRRGQAARAHPAPSCSRRRSSAARSSRSRTSDVARRRDRSADAQHPLELREVREAQSQDSARAAQLAGADPERVAARGHRRRAPVAEARGSPAGARDRSRGRAPRRGATGCSRARSRCSRSRARSARASRSRWSARRRSTTSTSRCGRSRRSSASATSSRTRSRNSRPRSRRRSSRRTTLARAKKEIRKLKMMSPMSAEATVVRNYVDWILALPWNEYKDEKKDIVEAERVLERGSLRPREAEGAHPRVPRGPDARREAEGPDPVPRRTARRRQDVARQVDRPRDGARLRAGVARRRPRRGRDPRPPPHLHRRAARQGAPVAAQGGLVEPGLPARRGRQDVDGLPRRSLGGAARSARSGAESHLRRPLSRPRLRPVARDVRVHRERAPSDPAPAPGSHGSHPASRLHRSREAGDRPTLPGAEGRRGEWAPGAACRVHRCRAARRDSLLHARVGRAQPRARAGLDLPEGRTRGGEGRGREGQETPRDARRRAQAAGRAASTATA